MEMLRKFTSTWAILLFCGFPPWSCGNFAFKNFEEKLVKLSKVIEYIHQRPQQMNVDVTLSLTIVQANIAAIFLHKNAQFLTDKHRNILMTILNLCDLTRRDLLNKIVLENEDIRLLHETINYPNLWMKKISWRHGALVKGRANIELPYRDIRDLVMQGVPKEEESDRCLAEIVRNKFNSDHRIPGLCLEILTTRESTKGYPLTHRLLIVQIAKIMECDQDLPSSELILFYCSAIFQDLINIEIAGFPYQTPDLMMEQVVLCGIEGFLEFTDKHYERLILDWSHPSGCFSSFGSKFLSNKMRIIRRTSMQTDFGCDNHATGLAAASLSLFIRKSLENMYE